MNHHLDELNQWQTGLHLDCVDVATASPGNRIPNWEKKKPRV